MRRVGRRRLAEQAGIRHAGAGGEVLQPEHARPLAAADADHVLETGGRRADVRDHVRVVQAAELPRDHRHLGPGVPQDVQHLVVPVDRHGGHEHRADPGQRDVDHDELVPVRQLNLDPVARIDAEPAQRGRQPVRLFPQLPPGQRAVSVGEQDLVLPGQPVDRGAERLVTPVARRAEPGQGLRVVHVLGPGNRERGHLRPHQVGKNFASSYTSLVTKYLVMNYPALERLGVGAVVGQGGRDDPEHLGAAGPGGHLEGVLDVGREGE